MGAFIGILQVVYAFLRQTCTARDTSRNHVKQEVQRLLRRMLLHRSVALQANNPDELFKRQRVICNMKQAEHICILTTQRSALAAIFWEGCSHQRCSGEPHQYG
jgi:hypothetical protein